MQVADQPPIKTPVCYTEHQIEVLQTLGKFTFVAHYETDDFLQKITHLLKKPDSTKITRLPTPWREKFRCLSLDQHDFLYMDERLIIPKVLRPIIIRSLHYGHQAEITCWLLCHTFGGHDFIVRWWQLHEHVRNAPNQVRISGLY